MIEYQRAVNESNLCPLLLINWTDRLGLDQEVVHAMRAHHLRPLTELVEVLVQNYRGHLIDTLPKEWPALHEA